MAKQDIHERGLAGAVLAQQRQHLATMQIEADRIVGQQWTEALGNAAQPEDDVLRLGNRNSGHQLDLGSPSLISTVKLPSLIAFSFSATLATTSAGTLPSKVPSGDRLQP